LPTSSCPRRQSVPRALFLSASAPMMTFRRKELTTEIGLADDLWRAREARDVGSRRRSRPENFFTLYSMSGCGFTTRPRAVDAERHASPRSSCFSDTLSRPPFCWIAPIFAARSVHERLTVQVLLRDEVSRRSPRARVRIL
jgi:hypothetical protein